VDIPEPLRLVESYLNSIDVETGADDLADLGRFTRWLAEHGRPVTPSADDLDLARRLRDALRGQARDHSVTGLLDPLATAIPLVVTWSGGDPALRPAFGGVRGVLGEILAAVALAGHDGSWRRMKICPADDCQWVYYDHSKNASRRWCSMEVCGNRNKTRAYRRRHRTADA